MDEKTTILTSEHSATILAFDASIKQPFSFTPPTAQAIRTAIGMIMQEVTGDDLDHHVRDTPNRVLLAYEELMSGVGDDPAAVLKTTFAEDCDELVVVSDIDFVSLCMHHLLPFVGKIHFGYLPDQQVVGLSKIPRMVEILARRPQIQERLGREIVRTFQEVVKPKGCGVIIDAWHGCVGVRGVRKPGAKMRTVALQGLFRDKVTLKDEFLTMALQGNNHK